MPEIQSPVEVLRRTPLFRALNQRQLERVAKRFVERSYAAGEKILTQGKGGEGFFVIAKGAAEAILEHDEDLPTVLNPLGPGEFFGEMALLTEGLRSASVVATEPTCCLVLTRWDFIGLLREDADMAVTILQALAERFSRVLSTL